MRTEMPEEEVMRAMDEAHEVGVKLEVHQGLPIWEFMPSPLHTMEAERIAQSIRRPVEGEGCGCHRFQDMTVMFPDGSVRRPDIAVFCRRPEATQLATRLVPEAVIEVVSPGSEIKDWDLSPPFYLLHGVKDVIVFDPRTGGVVHFRPEGRSRHPSPVEIALECGCVVTV